MLCGNRKMIIHIETYKSAIANAYTTSYTNIVNAYTNWVVYYIKIHMKIIQQDFKISSKIWCTLFLIALIIFTEGLINKNYDNAGKVFLGLFFGIIGLSLLLYNIYNFSFIYEFKQNEILIKPLFGLLGEKKNFLKI